MFKRNHLLFVIVEQDHEIEVLDVLNDIGITAFSRFTGTGTGIWQQAERDINPEKAIIIAVISRKLKRTVLKTLAYKAKLRETGRGIAFTMPVDGGVGVGIPFPTLQV
ncbi:MAG: hypothetical protein U9N14_04070 [Pseudomonadota bacterium]|nr:hypothetical protein [Pseudomonadota bacterium]